MDIQVQGQRAKQVSRQIKQLTVAQQEAALREVAKGLKQNEDKILEANKKDLAYAVENGIKDALLDRLRLDSARIDAMIEGVDQIIDLKSPVGEVERMTTRPNGLRIGQKRVPLGVIGIIYEARPNVTVDAFALCFKTLNTVILRGGKEAFNSNQAIVEVIREALSTAGVPADAVQLVQDTSRETANAMMKMNEYLDVLIPRGGAGLIQAVVKNSTVPVIETGIGNCHVYVDAVCDIEKAIQICVNAKVQRPGVCNSAESFVIHKDVAKEVLDRLMPELNKYSVEVRGDEFVMQYADVVPASEEDYATEFHDYIVAIKVVESFDEAIEHIETYSTGHSESIVTESYTNAERFLDIIDSAAVYVNASTRFTDGFEFGFGAEIGISTQKLHARGPMGLKELTTTKYIIYGNGQCK